MRRLAPATVCAHAGRTAPREGGGVVGPIETSTTFERDETYALPPSGDIYRRDDNATVREAEALICDLEGGAQARLFASGLAAMSVLMRASEGDIVVQESTYYGTRKLAELYQQCGRTVRFVDPSEPGALTAACQAQRPRLVVIESPSNPFLKVIDIQEVARAAHDVGALVVVDSTTATPILQRPLPFGADIVLHSATKALNGHSDVLAGALVTASADSGVWQSVKALRAAEGAVASPFDAWLLTRGMRTLSLRVSAMSRSALHIAQWLSTHPRIAHVYYPGLSTHPNHDVAAKQMCGGFGGLLSFEVAGGRQAALSLCAKLNIIRRATSLGSVESLIEHRHSIEPSHMAIPPGLLRLSVGIEALEDLVTDLASALDAAH